MVGAYSYMRKKYFISVVLMTTYLLLMFHLLYPADFRTILTDRIVDTAIGSAIAILFGYLLSPIWEHEQVNEYMNQSLKDIIDYYRLVSATFTGTLFHKPAAVVERRKTWVSLANLSDTFNKMLSEPKSKQKNVKELHQFVVANHMITSHIATLSYYADSVQPEFVTDDYQPLINATVQVLEQSLDILEKKKNTAAIIKADPEQVRILSHRINELVVKRQEELKQGQMESSTGKYLSNFKSIADQFYFIYRIAVDMEKISGKLAASY